MSAKQKRKRNSTTESFVVHSKEMRESIAWRFLSDSARRVLDRLELEHMRHGGADNGNLPCTYSDFAEAGIRRASVAQMIRQCQRLGFVEVTETGGKSISSYRRPNRYRLTYVFGCGSSPDPTHEWKRISTEEQALAAINQALAERNYETQPRKRSKNQNAGRATATRVDASASLQSA